MPLYSCHFCNLSTKLKTDFNRHLKTSKHKRKIEEFRSENEKTLKMSQNEPKMSQNEPKRAKNEPANLENLKFENRCKYCDRVFKTKANMRRHELHRCEIGIQNSNLIKENLELKKEKKKLYTQIDKLIEKAGNTTMIQGNQTNNIQLNNYGKEDISHITDSLKGQYLKIPYGAIPKMIEAIHFNDNKPENKNIQLTNKKENTIKVFQNNKWIYKNKEETINDLVDGKYMILDNFYEVLETNQELTDYTKGTYLNFRDHLDNQTKEVIDKLKKECELVLLNNR